MTKVVSGIGIVVFSRFDSSRLPGKALRPIAGRPMLQHVIKRLQKVKSGNPICMATTERPVDQPICEFATGLGASVFRGDVEDVSKRAFDCAVSQGFDHIVRISGDSPFIDPDVVSRGIAIHMEERPDLTTNVNPRTYPFGCSVEVISRSALARVLAIPAEIADREHVTRPIYAAKDAFKIRNFASGRDEYAGVRLVVDTTDDLERAEWIAARARPAAIDASLDEIVHWARMWPQREQPSQSIAEKS